MQSFFPEKHLNMTDDWRAIIMIAMMFFYFPWSKYLAGLFLILKLSPTTAIS